jgi:hypothetical protein
MNSLNGCADQNAYSLYFLRYIKKYLYWKNIRKTITPIQFEVKDIFIIMRPYITKQVIAIEQKSDNFDISNDKHCDLQRVRPAGHKNNRQ